MRAPFPASASPNPRSDTRHDGSMEARHSEGATIDLRLPRLEERRTIDAPAEAVWELLTDTSRWPEWGPSITRVDCATRFIGAGSRGRVRTITGLWVPFQITHWVDRTYWSWKVLGLPATGHGVEPRPQDRCSLTFTVPAPAAPYLLVCRIAIDRIERILRSSP